MITTITNHVLHPPWQLGSLSAQLSGWATDADFVERMSRHVAREAKELSFVGDEWSDAQSLVEAGPGGVIGWFDG